MRHFLLILLALAASGCDPEHRKKCEWFLSPDPDRVGAVEAGYIPVCARNFETNKQDCRLQAKLDFAKANATRRFRYVDLKVKTTGNPRTVDSITFCE